MTPLAYYSPLGPARSGVVDYAEAMLAGLRKHFAVRVNEDAPADWPRLFHIGNNPLHWPHYQRALREPGVVILHDAVLHHLLLGQLTREEYIAEFVHNYGAWHAQTAERLWERRGQSAADATYFARPMLRRLAENSRAVIVHNRAAAELLRRHCASVRIETLPHFFSPPRPFSYWEIDQYREKQLGVPREEVLFGVLGHLRESKRLESVLDTVSEVRRHGVPLRLLVQGDFVGPDLERSLASRLGADGVIRRGYMPEEEWWLMAHALDGVVNLRWPSAGESSGIATRLMGIGKAVLVTRGLETMDLPEVSVVKVDPGLPEREELSRFLAWLALNKEARLSIGRHAARHIAEHHSLEAILAQVQGILTGSLRAA